MTFTERQMFYEIGNREDLERRLSNIQSYQDIFELISGYNWDDGFDLPELISEHLYCDLAAALLLFHYSDGYSYLMNEDIRDDDCRRFVHKMFDSICSGKYKSHSISFSPGFNKVQKFKIMKIRPNLKDIFIDGV